MKSRQSTEYGLLIFLLLLTILLVAHAIGKAQQYPPKGQVVPPRQVPQRPVRATPPPPVAPVQRTVPARVQQQVRQQVTQLPQTGQKIAQPFRRVVAGGKASVVKPAGVQGAQPGAQAYQAAGGRSAQRPVAGLRPVTTTASLGSQPGGFRAPPNARSVAAPGGGARVVHPDGRQWVVDKNNQVRTFSRPGLQANYNGDGRLSSVRVARPNGNMVVARSGRGDRQALAMRPGGVAVVSYGKGRGFVQRPMPGRPGYFKRTSMVDGRSAAHVYRAYGYRGTVYFRPEPAYYYQPKFYGWVQNPWPAAVAYDWNSRPSPWLGFYAGYFTPAQAYPTASGWLTDFVLSSDLKTAYQNRQEYEQSSASPAPPNEAGAETAALSPEVKEKISQEVQGQIADEQTAAQSGGQGTPGNAQAPPPALDPSFRTFVVSQSLDLGETGAACTVTPGDVIERTGDNLLAGNKVAVNVVSSKAGDCPVNTSSQVEVGTLQEMYNQFREQIDTGLSTLAANVGRGGLPPGPPPGARPSPEGTTQPDPDAAGTLAETQTDADQAEGAAAAGQNAVASM